MFYHLRRKPQHVFIIIGVLHLEAQAEPTNNETNGTEQKHLSDHFKYYPSLDNLFIR